MTAHLAKGHLAAFDSYAELPAFVDCPETILNKLGLIVKTRNGITKANMILDTRQSGANHVASQAQRVTPPRRFDAILQLLYLLTCMMADTNERFRARQAVSALVLGFSDACWQIPISSSEQQFFCATGLIRGKRKWIAFLRAP